MPLYIAFSDSQNDPTYTLASEAVLVESDGEGYNPCVGENIKRAFVLPENVEQLKALASMHGWDWGFDNDGQLILYTGMKEESEEVTDDAR